MTHRLVATLLAGLALLLCPLEASAQSFDPRVSVRLGTIDRLGVGREGFDVLYPEVEVENRLYLFEAAKLSLDGSVYAGYWSDGLAWKERDCLHGCFAYRSLAVGARLRAAPTAVPLGLFGGVSYHAFSGSVEEPFGRTGVEEQLDYAAAEAGLRADIPLIRGWRLVAQGQAHLSFTERDIVVRRSLTFGVSFPL